MILIDTSVWIELLGKRPRLKLPADRLPEVATCSIVIQEVLQGIRDDLAHRRLRESFLALPKFGDPVDLPLFLEASEIFRAGRRRGLTVRSSVDCLIAATAIRHHLPVWHQDRDFDVISRFTGLRTASL